MLQYDVKKQQSDKHLVKFLLKFREVFRDGMKYFRRNGVDVIVFILALASLRLIQLKELPNSNSNHLLIPNAHTANILSNKRNMAILGYHQDKLVYKLV